ncbi:peptide-methionine (R)-S-oxide reductase MsrB [Mucilaginibacter polytrichastri]|uniref:peptide-methionine (R)-S-oxide reductase n=1 Tax=Mucilaginibacter polytrichastri TaxID=1302689 RepID=A0A1Q5ZXH2_9SPHI|nr:peptide-methionine (R)-S-oxide reductase MsrB [Mucilaginibacter polytrichastri]OKS86466.1 Peptide methionine sulfoxide reductase MsrB [Mucilaginibacter polytrichastri]SFS78462.1 methionine-R-sulfoxide reductase [Mucilaginibacter polytrichastri]
MKKLANIFFVSSIILFGCQQMNGQGSKTKTTQVQVDKWKNKLSPNEYDIMVNKGTEPPFKNAYWDNHQKGIYVSAATGEVLFSSDDKFDSGTGWPSFVKPVNAGKIAVVTDDSYGMERTEVVEKSTGLHLGHVFDDGPADRGGKRYCMNSGALKFIKQ